jgi:hypothetical protein
MPSFIIMTIKDWYAVEDHGGLDEISLSSAFAFQF